MDLLEQETVNFETGYQVPLMWKEGEARLQNNRQVALKRLEGLEKRFARDPPYELDYRKAIDKYVNNGYAVKVNEDDDVWSTVVLLLIMVFIRSPQLKRSSE